MSEETFVFDKSTAELLVKDTADLVIKQFVIDHKIRLDDTQMEVLAQATVKHIELEIDYPAIADNVIKKISELKNSTDLFITEAVRGDLFEKIKKEIRKPLDGADGKDGLDGKDGKEGKAGLTGIAGKDYVITDKDRVDIVADVRKSLPIAVREKGSITKRVRADIAEEAVNNLLSDAKSMEAVISAVASDKRIVSRDALRRKLKEIREMINQSQRQGKGRINAGISGQDMIDDITKILGTTWQTGGVADLKLPPIIKTVDATLALSDTQNVIEYQNGVNNRIFTIQLNVVVPLPIGSWFETWRTGSGELTIQIGAPAVTFRTVLGNKNFKIDGQDGFSVIGLKTDTDTWLFKGNIKAV